MDLCLVCMLSDLMRRVISICYVKQHCCGLPSKLCRCCIFQAHRSDLYLQSNWRIETTFGGKLVL